jgi:hypothetical protein
LVAAASEIPQVDTDRSLFQAELRPAQIHLNSMARFEQRDAAVYIEREPLR